MSQSSGAKGDAPSYCRRPSAGVPAERENSPVRLALATKPYDVFFLAHIPATNTDNSWNASNLRGCEEAKSLWVQLTSRKAEGAEQYKIDFARDVDAFPEPKWPRQSLNTLIVTAFSPDRMIDREDHPGLLRLIGAKQPLR